MRLALTLILAFLISSASAFAAEPPPSACAPGDPHVYCALIDQRNNAQNQLAVTIGKALDAEDLADRTKLYWQKYVSSEDAKAVAAAAQEAHWRDAQPFLKGACGWRGLQNEPMAKLCAWWKGKTR